MSKNILNILLVTKMFKKLDLSAHFFQKWVHVEEIFNETKSIYFLIKDNKLLEKYDEIWTKVSNSIKKYFYIEPVYNEKYLKINIKSYEKKINTNFHNNKIPKEDCQHICLWAYCLIQFIEKMKTK